MSNPTPGWYPDPIDSNKLRYWDGQDWTKNVRNKDNTLAQRIEKSPLPKPNPFLFDLTMLSMGLLTFLAFLSKSPILLGLVLAMGVYILVMRKDIFLLKDKPNALVNNPSVTSKSVKFNYKLYDAALTTELQIFAKNVQAHRKLRNVGLGELLTRIANQAQELFLRLDRNSLPVQKQLASLEYVNVFTKLNKALGEDYYLDIVKNPTFWDNASERLVTVKQAAEAVEQALLTNLKQVNASQDLEFQSALDALMSLQVFDHKTMLEAPRGQENFWEQGQSENPVMEEREE